MAISRPPQSNNLKVLLQYIACNMEDEADELIKNDTQLLLLHGDLIDMAGRRFGNLTALQLADLTGFKDMIKMIERHFITLPNGQVEMQKQRDEITPPQPEAMPLLKAYQKYVENYDKWSDEVSVTFFRTHITPLLTSVALTSSSPSWSPLSTQIPRLFDTPWSKVWEAKQATALGALKTRLESLPQELDNKEDTAVSPEARCLMR